MFGQSAVARSYLDGKPDPFATGLARNALERLAALKEVLPEFLPSHFRRAWGLPEALKAQPLQPFTL
jgi:hypothetical protein